MEAFLHHAGKCLSSLLYIKDKRLSMGDAQVYSGIYFRYILVIIILTCISSLYSLAYFFLPTLLNNWNLLVISADSHVLIAVRFRSIFLWPVVCWHYQSSHLKRSTAWFTCLGLLRHPQLTVTQEGGLDRACTDQVWLPCSCSQDL